LGALLLVVVTLTVLLLNIGTIARSQINKALDRYLVAGGNLGAVDVHLLEGRVALSSLVIHPPPGFEPHPLLFLKSIEVDVVPWALFKGKVVIENVAVKGLSLNIIRDKKGQLSPLELMVAQAPGPEPQPENQSTEDTSPWIPVVHAHTIQVEDVSFRLADRMLEKDWSASLKAGLKVEGVRLEDLLNLDILVERVDLKLNDILVDQPPGFSREPLLAVNRIEVAFQDIDFKASSVPAADVILDTLSVSLERNPDREINIINLAQSWLPAESISSSSTSAPPSAASIQSSDSGFRFPVVTVDNIQLNSISAQLLDSMDGQPWQAGFDGLDIGVKGLEVGDLSKMDVSLTSLEMGLRGIAVDQPPGFSKEPLLAINKIDVSSSGIDLGRPKVSLSDVILDTLSVSLERNADREVNLLKLTESWLPAKDESDNETPVASSATPTESSGPVFEIPAVVVDNIQLNSIRAQLLDSIDGQPWRAGFEGLDIQVKGAAVEDLARQAISLASLNLDLKSITVDQPPGYSETPLLSMGSLKLVSQGMDLGASEVTVSDVLLDTLKISLERNVDREINLLKLAKSWLPASDEGDNGSSVPAPAPPASPDPGLKIPAVVVNDVELKSISAQLLAFIEGQHWRAGFDGLDIHIAGLEVSDPAQPAISLATLDLDLRGITVDQPPGFGNGKLVGLEQFTIISGKPERPGTELVIKQIMLQDLTSFVTMRADGMTNLQVLKEELLGKDRADQPAAEEPIVEREAPSPAPDRQPILVEQISLDGGPVTYRDEAFAEEPLEATLNNIQMGVKGLHLFTDKKDMRPASAALSFEFSQPGDLPTGYFGTLSSVGPLGDGVPMVNSQVRLVGLKLDTLGSLVPPATRATLGATGLDAGAALAMDSDSINLVAGALTDRGIKYKGLRVQGPLTAPIVQPGPLLTGVLSRVSDGLVNMGKGGLKSGVDIAEGGVGAAKELGTGAVKVGANLGKSLFSATAGIVTFDKDKVKEGASGTTKGTMDLTKDSVKGSGKAAEGGLKSSASDLKGQDRVKAWEQDIPTRYEVYMQQARTALTEMPYPPVTE